MPNRSLPRMDADRNVSGDCLSCATGNRRAFVQNAIAGVASLLGLSMMNASSAFAQIEALATPQTGNRGATTYPVPTADGVSIDNKNEVIIARANGNVYAFALACPHQNTMLRWRAKDSLFQCPKHESKYAPSGEFLSGRATRNMDRFAIRLEGANVIVDISTEIHSDQEPAKWAAAFVKVTG